MGFMDLPRRGALSRIARRAVTMALPRWHSTEAVNAIVYGTRAFDTLGETFLLVAAVVSVLMVARRREERHPGARAEEAQAMRERERLERSSGFPEIKRGAGSEEVLRAESAEEAGLEDRSEEVIGFSAPDHNEGMTVVVRVATQILLAVLAVAALVVVAWGYAPGGGFPAGVALAGVVLLVYASRGLAAVGPFGRSSVLELVEVAGAVGLLAVAVGGLIAHGTVTANFLPLGHPGTIQGGGILQAFSGIETFEVVSAVLLVEFGLLTMHHDWAEEEAS